MSVDFSNSREEVSSRIKADVKGQLPASNPYLRNSFLQALIFGLAGRIFDLFKLAGNLINELFWDTATGDFLKRHASVWGIERTAATPSSGNATAIGVAGNVIPIGTQLQGSDGETYETKNSVTLATNLITLSSLTQAAGLALATTPSDHGYAAGIDIDIAGANESDYNGTVTILTTPTEDTFTYAIDPGAASPATGAVTSSAVVATMELESENESQETNRSSGDSLVFSGPIPGVEDTAFVQSDGISGGTNLEGDVNFRNRFLFRVQNPVALFNDNAIENKAKEVPGVTRVWVFSIDTTQGALNATALTQLGNEVAVFNLIAHGLQAGQKITVTGAVEPEYNVSSKKSIIIDADNFAYAIAGNPSSPATGTPVAAYSLVEEGQTIIYFARDNDASPIPSAAEIAAVKAAILEIKPAHMSDDDVIVNAPVAVSTNFTFNSINPDTTTMRTAIADNLEAFFRDKGELGEDVTQDSYSAAIFNTLDPETNQPLLGFNLNSPAADISVGRGQLPTLGTVAF